MRVRRRYASSLSLLCAASLVAICAPQASAVPDAGRGYGRMGPAHARVVAVNPATGADFEMPFVCGEAWTGSTRSSHSPSSYTIDFNAPDDLGRPVVASAPGVVTRTEWLTTSYGRHVVIDHGNGYSSLYGHLNSIRTTLGAHVDQGDLIGYLGTTGNSTGPHLHFEERLNGAYFRPYFHRATYAWGTRTSANCGDSPIVGDWNGGVDDVGVHRPTSSAGEFRELAGTTTRAITSGRSQDYPLVGDWDGNGLDEVGYRSPGSTTIVRRAANGTLSTITGFGLVTDTPVTGDWDGDGRSEVGVYRASDQTFRLRYPLGKVAVVHWGATGQRPVTGDWNGDGRTEVGMFDPATGLWTLRVRSGASYVTRKIDYGAFGDLPAPGDWNGDGITDLGIWRMRTAIFHKKVPVGGGDFDTRYATYGARR